MSAKLTIEQMQALAQEHDGGVCLSTVYVNQSTKLRWRCSEGHEWDATPNDVKNNHWCPACGGTLRSTIEQMQMLAEKHDGVCLSTVYVNSYTKLRWRCVEGHEWETTPSAMELRVKTGYWCPKCPRGALAQSNLGLMYTTGEGVPEDDAEAVRWYRLAAEQGVARAQYSLGFKYATGAGVPQDDVEAVRWYRLAADQGEANAQNNLGLMYETGTGVPQDYVQAHTWYNLAASRLTGEKRDSAVGNRDVVAGRMTPTRIAEAQRLVRTWDAAHPREP